MSKRIKPFDQYPITETFAASDDEADAALATVYRKLEEYAASQDSLLTLAPFSPKIAVEPQTNGKGRGT